MFNRNFVKKVILLKFPVVQSGSIPPKFYESGVSGRIKQKLKSFYLYGIMATCILGFHVTS